MLSIEQKTINKANELIKNNLVSLLYDGITLKIFRVKDYEVYFKFQKSKTLWSCGAVTQRRKNERDLWGCVMQKPSVTPYCSHTLACELFLKKGRK